MVKLIETVEEALSLLEQAVADKPEGFKYADEFDGGILGCVYAEIDDKTGTLQPCCIVGVAAYKLGGEGLLSELHLREGGNILSVGRVLSENTEVIEVLQAAQQAQDTGRTWAEALVKAQERAAV